MMRPAAWLCCADTVHFITYNTSTRRVCSGPLSIVVHSVNVWRVVMRKLSESEAGSPVCFPPVHLYFPWWGPGGTKIARPLCSSQFPRFSYPQVISDFKPSKQQTVLPHALYHLGKGFMNCIIKVKYCSYLIMMLNIPFTWPCHIYL